MTNIVTTDSITNFRKTVGATNLPILTDENKISRKRQLEFGKHMSTTQAALTLINNIIQGFEDKYYLTAFLDKKGSNTAKPRTHHGRSIWKSVGLAVCE